MLVSLSAPLNREWAESTDSHAHTGILYTFSRHWRHLRRGLRYLQKTLTWSHALDDRWVFLTPGRVDVVRWRSVQEFRVQISAWIDISRRFFKWFSAVRKFAIPQSFYRIRRSLKWLICGLHSDLTKWKYRKYGTVSAKVRNKSLTHWFKKWLK